MITTNNTGAKVIFGTDKKATIAVSADANKLILQMLKQEKQIGESLTEKDKQEHPKIEIDFFTPKSIEVLIEALECIKRNIQPPPIDYSLALAC